jgi:haloalkane dehalogenase
MQQSSLEARDIEVAGYRIHYIETGRGAATVFVHGNPTSSHLWRNVLGPVARGTRRRCIALDLLGFGESDRPAIRYSLPLHASILSGFIEKLGLTDVALVAEDWGGPLAAAYAGAHPANVHSVALMGTFLWPLDWQADFRPCIRALFKSLRSPFGFVSLQLMNMLTRTMLPRYSSIGAQDLQHYIDSFPTVRSRRAMRMFTQLLPINGRPAESHRFIVETAQACAAASWPLLWIKATPGLIPADDYPPSLASLEAFRQRVPRLTLKEFGPGQHFLAEEDPQRLADLLVEWFCELAPHAHQGR